MKNFINSLTKEQVLNEQLPLKLLLENSLYYPACHFDGGTIKYSNTKMQEARIQSFIYCDYQVNEFDLKADVRKHFRGYTIFADRSIKKEELLTGSNSYYAVAPFYISEEEKEKYMYWGSKCKPFCHWFIMEREKDFDETHGPERFSLLYICGEGVATYLQLYNANNIVPIAIAVIQPGTGWGFNWTDFRDEEKPLGQVMHKNEKGMPKYFFYGGIGNKDLYIGEFQWRGYELYDEIFDYYEPGDGYVQVFRNK